MPTSTILTDHAMTRFAELQPQSAYPLPWHTADLYDATFVNLCNILAANGETVARVIDRAEARRILEVVNLTIDKSPG